MVGGMGWHRLFCIDTNAVPLSLTWRSVTGDLSDEEWELIADLFPTYSGGVGWDGQRSIRSVLL